MNSVLLASLVALLCSCRSAPKTRPLFNGVDLAGWHLDVPAMDEDPSLPSPFIVRDARLVSLGQPNGHLITDESYADYELALEYRWVGEPGNCGVLVHVSQPRRLYGMFPQSIECQMHAGNAGDFWCIGEDISVDDMLARRGPEENWGVEEGQLRRIQNTTDGSEHPAGEWNEMRIVCSGSSIDIWVNGEWVNAGYNCSADHGAIAIQAEGAACEFRKLELRPLAARSQQDG